MEIALMETNKMKISAIGTFKNCIKLGYPFIEAILSIYPIVDELLLNDGGSEDETVDYLYKLAQNFFPKVQIFHIPWGGRNCEKQFDASLNALIEKATGDWLIEVQGDEIWHEENLFNLHSWIELLDKLGYNSIRHRCLTVSGWTSFDNYQYWHVRIVKKVAGLVSAEWGDCFHIRGQKSVKEGFTSHNVSPEFCIDIPCYHIHRVFPENKILADEAMAYQNAEGDPPREKIAELSRQMNDFHIPQKEEVVGGLPALVEDLWRITKYEVRDKLFDRDWLMKKTGLRRYLL